MIMNKHPWEQGSLYLTLKKAHFQPINSIAIHQQHSFLTSSEDYTVRLWDSRTMSSVKIIKNKYLNDGEMEVYVASAKLLYGFDLRKQSIIIQQPSFQPPQPHYDQINDIVYSKQHQLLAACDDEGDTRLYSPNLQSKGMLDQHHTNISYSLDFIYPQSYQYPICVTSGYDCQINIWDTSQAKNIKSININQLLANASIKTQSPPLIHSLKCYHNTIFASTQTGHILCLPFNQPRKPKFILEASFCPVKVCRLAAFNNNILVTASKDQSFSMFDYSKRQKGYPQFLEKFKVKGQPFCLETTQKHILVGSDINELSIYTIKG